MKFTKHLSLAACLLAARCAQTAPPPSPTPAPPNDDIYKIGDRFTIHSQILNEDRPYWIYLPGSYRDKDHAPKSYPVLYLLDGGAHFHSASGVVQFMSAGINGNTQIPEMIIVAIPNTFRTRDLTPTHTTIDESGKEQPSFAGSGGGEAFLNFIQTELIPQIEARYRTMPYRILVGHSFGGLLAMDALLRRPRIFQAFIAIDPSVWWDRQVLLHRTQEMLSKTNDFCGAVYISAANNPPILGFDPQPAKKAILDFADLLKGANSPGFTTTVQYFEAENHGSVPLLSLYNGLLFIFDGYKPAGDFYENPSLLTEHFKKVSEHLGVQFLPPESMVEMYGNYMLYDQRSPAKAVEWFKVNVAAYPNSLPASDNLARAYAMQGEKALTLANYKRSLELNGNLWIDDENRWNSTANALVNLINLGDKPVNMDTFLARCLPSALSVNPNNERLVRMRGEVCARTAHWREAAAAFSKLIELGHGNHQYYHALAPLLVMSGNLAEYRHRCALELRRFGHTADPATAERMTKDCLFVSSFGVDVASVAKWADTAVREGVGSPNLPYFQFAKGLAEYRLAHYDRAVDWLGKVVGQGVIFRDAEAYLVLAMAQHQLHQSEAARAALIKGRDVIENRMPKLGDGDLGDAWIDWIMAQSLLKEAESLLEFANN
jgi:uncharacterized protein